MKLHAARTLAGHVVRADMEVRLDGATEPTSGSTFYGVDSHTQELVCVSIKADREGLERGAVMWTDKGAMVASYPSRMEGKVRASRSRPPSPPRS